MCPHIHASTGTNNTNRLFRPVIIIHSRDILRLTRYGCKLLDSFVEYFRKGEIMWLFPATHMPMHPLPRNGDWQLEKAILYHNLRSQRIQIYCLIGYSLRYRIMLVSGG
jgi:hypothetical protein